MQNKDIIDKIIADEVFIADKANLWVGKDFSDGKTFIGLLLDFVAKNGEADG